MQKQKHKQKQKKVKNKKKNKSETNLNKFIMELRVKRTHFIFVHIYTYTYTYTHKHHTQRSMKSIFLYLGEGNAICFTLFFIVFHLFQFYNTQNEISQHLFTFIMRFVKDLMTFCLCLSIRWNKKFCIQFNNGLASAAKGNRIRELGYIMSQGVR